MAALLTHGRVVARRLLKARLAPVDRLHTINTVQHYQQISKRRLLTTQQFGFVYKVTNVYMWWC